MTTKFYYSLRFLLILLTLTIVACGNTKDVQTNPNINNKVQDINAQNKLLQPNLPKQNEKSGAPAAAKPKKLKVVVNPSNDTATPHNEESTKNTENLNNKKPLSGTQTNPNINNKVQDINAQNELQQNVPKQNEKSGAAALVLVRPSNNTATSHNEESTENPENLNNQKPLHSGIFDKLTKLKKLYLNNNQLETLPNGIFDHNTKLHLLYLDNNQLKTLPNGIFDNLTKLDLLYLNNNQLETFSLKTFDSLDELNLLKLKNNKLTDKFMDELKSHLNKTIGFWLFLSL